MGKGRRQYSVLDGVLRDLVACQGDDDEGWQRLVTFVRIIADVIDILDDEDSSLPDSDEESGEESDAQMELSDTSDRPPMGGPDARHDPVRGTHVGEPSTLVSAMERVRQLARAAQQAEELAGVPGRAEALVRATRHVTGGGA